MLLDFGSRTFQGADGADALQQIGPQWASVRSACGIVFLREGTKAERITISRGSSQLINCQSGLGCSTSQVRRARLEQQQPFRNVDHIAAANVCRGRRFATKDRSQIE
jgi:hypothetical protein